MKKSFLKSLTILLVLSMAMTILALRQNVLARKKSAPRILLAAILPLSSCSRSTRMIFKGMMCCALVIVCVSCKSVSSVQEFRSLGVQEFRSIDTIYRHDSVYVREVMRGDTVYLTHTEYRDRWRIREVHDTIHNTQYITQTIEHPPEKYVPKFYKWCTGLFWAIGLLAIGYWLLKWWLKCRV